MPSLGEENARQSADGRSNAMSKDVLGSIRVDWVP